MDDWAFVHTGSGTLAGRYLRRFWQPVYESARLEAGRAVPIEVLGERFALYRGETGAAHAVENRCPHRGNMLSTGRVIGDEIECFYHGWAFDPTGACVRQPAEPKPFCNKVRIRNIPTAEVLGFVFVYLGEGEPPPLPSFPEFEHPDAVTSIQMIPCNYFQSAENIMDDVHVGFAHRAVRPLAGSDRGASPPVVSAEETPYGLVALFGGAEVVERNLWLMPNICCVGYNVELPMGKRHMKIRMRTMFWYVPIDDVRHNHVMVTVPEAGFAAAAMRLENEEPHDVALEIRRILAGESYAHIDGPPAGHRIPDLIRIQDGVSVVGQGAIVDRSRDRLGASDAAVILLRKVWQRELRRLEAGEPPTEFVRPDDLLGLLSRA